VASEREKQSIVVRNRVSLAGENHRHVARRFSRVYRNWRRDAESSDADSDCSVGFRRISSDSGRHSYRVALGTYRREPFPRWSLFALRAGDQFPKRVALGLVGFSHTGNTLHNQLFFSTLRLKALQSLTPT
jgi:hypothetical protein